MNLIDHAKEELKLIGYDLNPKSEDVNDINDYAATCIL